MNITIRGGAYEPETRTRPLNDYVVGRCVCIPRFICINTSAKDGRDFKQERDLERDGYQLKNAYTADSIHVSVFEYPTSQGSICVRAETPEQAFAMYDQVRS